MTDGFLAKKTIFPKGFEILYAYRVQHNGMRFKPIRRKDSKTLTDSSFRTKNISLLFLSFNEITYYLRWVLGTAIAYGCRQRRLSVPRKQTVASTRAESTCSVKLPVGAWERRENRYIGKAFTIRFVLEAEKLRKRPDDVKDMATIDAHGMFL